MRMGVVKREGWSGPALSAVCELLSFDLGRTVSGVPLADDDALADALGYGEVDLAWGGAAALFRGDALRDVEPLLTANLGRRTLPHAVFYTSTRSPLRGLTELLDTDVAWVDETSIEGYLAPRLALTQAGYNPDDTFRRQTFYGNHRAAAKAVLAGEADVGATYGHFEGRRADGVLIGAGFQEVGAFARARVIHAVGPLPTGDVLVVKTALPPSLRQHLAAVVSRLLTDPIGGPPLRELMGVEDLAPLDADIRRTLRGLLSGRRLRPSLTTPALHP
ncbi:MAG: PhnD/SsuA/transferrin family substrate-binding protein [Myxococcota bacterium]